MPRVPTLEPTGLALLLSEEPTVLAGFEMGDEFSEKTMIRMESILFAHALNLSEHTVLTGMNVPALSKLETA